jgi:hypothetical protein
MKTSFYGQQFCKVEQMAPYTKKCPLTCNWIEVLLLAFDRQFNPHNNKNVWLSLPLVGSFTVTF